MSLTYIRFLCGIGYSTIVKYIVKPEIIHTTGNFYLFIYFFTIDASCNSGGSLCHFFSKKKKKLNE